MHSYLEQYPSKQTGVTLHTWTEHEGRKEENFYISPPYTFFLLNDDMELNRNRQFLV